MQKTYEELLKILEKIKKEDILLIVEGIKDKKALEKLGFKNIFALNRMALYKVVEIIVKKCKKCIILTDLDKEGKKIYKTLNSDLCQRGIYIDNMLRDFLFRKTKLRQMEGIDSYVKRLED